MISWCPLFSTRSSRNRNAPQPTSSRRRVPLTIEDHLQKFGEDIILPAMESGIPGVNFAIVCAFVIHFCRIFDWKLDETNPQIQQKLCLMQRPTFVPEKGAKSHGAMLN
jgi:hypothetical protein